MVNDNSGGCFWAYVAGLFLLGLALFPLGIVLWAIAVHMIIELIRNHE